MKTKTAKTTTVYVATANMWDEGLKVTPVQCIDHEKVLEAPDSIAPIGFIKNLKKAKMPIVDAHHTRSGAVALTEEEAVASLLRALKAKREDAEKELKLYEKQIHDVENKVPRVEKYKRKPL